MACGRRRVRGSIRWRNFRGAARRQFGRRRRFDDVWLGLGNAGGWVRLRRLGRSRRPNNVRLRTWDWLVWLWRHGMRSRTRRKNASRPRLFLPLTGWAPVRGAEVIEV